MRCSIQSLLLAACAVLVLLPLRGFAQSTATISGLVSTDAGSALDQVRILVDGRQYGVTDKAGRYNITAPTGRIQLSAQRMGLGPQSRWVEVAAGQSLTSNFEMAYQSILLDAVVATGTRRVDRTVRDAPVPVDVLSSEALRRTGLVDANAVLQRLAPSFNFPRATVTDGTDHVRPATLRGLAPDQLLVLVNGKRRHSSALVNVNNSVGRGAAAVDLNALPVSAIERIEILRDGASAQYGSDAIAGVINIILKSAAETELTTMAGQTQQGDGTVLHAAARHGFALGDGGMLTVTGELRDRAETNRTLPDLRPQYFPGDPRNSDPALTGQINHRQGDPNARDIVGFANVFKSLGAARLYGFGGVSSRKGDAAGFWRRALDDRTVRSIHPNGFLPIINSDILDASAALGIDGSTSGWKWDLSAVYGSNTFGFDITNSNNASLGDASPTSFHAGKLKASQGALNLDVVKSIALGLAAPVNVALGAELRRDSYGIVAGEEDSYRDGLVPVLDGPSKGARTPPGAQVFPGFRPTDESSPARTNAGGYIDLDIAVARGIDVAAAGRVERYSDFGSTATGKLALRVQPMQGLALRGALNTGFRAPSLQQANFSSTATNFIVVNGVNTPFEVRTFPVASAVAQALGARALEPETSFNVSAGIVLNPTRDLSITADFYAIDIDDRIVLTGNFIGADVRAMLENRGFPGTGGGRYFTNGIDTETRGLDIVAYYGIDLKSAGVLRLTGAFNATASKVVRIASNPTQLATQNEVLFDRVEKGRIEYGQPRRTLALTAGWTKDRIALTVHNQRFGRVWFFGVTPALDQTFSAKWLTDVDASYRVGDHMTVTAGASNLFNVYPDKNKDADLQPIGGPLSNNGIFPYNGVSPFGMNGAFYYLRVSWQR